MMSCMILWYCHRHHMSCPAPASQYVQQYGNIMVLINTAIRIRIAVSQCVAFPEPSNDELGLRRNGTKVANMRYVRIMPHPIFAMRATKTTNTHESRALGPVSSNFIPQRPYLWKRLRSHKNPGARNFHTDSIVLSTVLPYCGFGDPHYEISIRCDDMAIWVCSGP